MTVLRYANFKLRSRILAGDLPAWLQKHPRAAYIIACVRATPAWVHWPDIRALGKRAKELTRMTGTQHVVDHIVPLTHPYVCGLNVPDNMQVIPYGPNAAKGNAFHPDQPELFPELPVPKVYKQSRPHQFVLWLDPSSPSTNAPSSPAGSVDGVAAVSNAGAVPRFSSHHG